MENTESGSTVQEAANSILGLLDSEESDTPETPSEEAPESDDSEDFEESESDEDIDDESEGDEDSAEDEEEPDTLDDSTVIEIDGEQVTLAELKAGRLRQADYTRKTQALATERKALEAEAAQTREARDKYAAGLEQLAQALQRIKPAEPDWDTLRKENPAEFAAQWADHERLRIAEQSAQAERQRIAEEQAREQQETLGSYLDEQKKLLQDAIPEWKDESKAKAEKEQLIESARALGFSDEELGGVTDHRLVILLRKAAKYDEITTKGAETIRVKKATAKVLKPGSRDAKARPSTRKAEREASDRLRKTGHVRDAAEAIFHMID